MVIHRSECIDPRVGATLGKQERGQVEGEGESLAEQETMQEVAFLKKFKYLPAKKITKNIYFVVL